MDAEREPTVGEILHRLATDTEALAKDQFALASAELKQSIKKSAVSAAGVLLGGVVALIGVGLLCLAGVVALEPVIPSLALRLVLMAAVYGVVGVLVARSFTGKLEKDLSAGLPRTTTEAKETVEAVKEELSHA
jgi:uncharacterized membrane protein YqjE